MLSSRPLACLILLGLWLSGTGAALAQDDGTREQEEWRQARYQSTWNTQRHPAFAAAGSGMNSLGDRKSVV
mgnify:CR=1 FL=1